MKESIKRTMKKLIAIMLIIAVYTCLFPADIKVSAATEPRRPKITIESIANGNAVIITIAKTKNTDAYEIYVKAPGAKEYANVDFLYKSGKAVRRYLVRTPENGKYSFKVRGVYFADGDVDIYSKYSKVKSVTFSAEPKDLSGLQTGDYVIFGSYEQNGDVNDGKEPIEWIVLSNKDSKLFLLSRYVLEPGKMNPSTDAEVTYENSRLRKWLNEDFYKTAFSDEEAGIIASTKLEDVNTEDKVFLLSWAECKTEGNGLMEKMDRRCGATTYARMSLDRDGDGKKESVYTCVGFEEDRECRAYDGAVCCYWWLRTKVNSEQFMLIGERGGKTSTTYYGKRIFSGHYDADGDEKYYVWGYGIRPAMVVDLNDAAGLVISTGRNVADQKTVFEAEGSVK